METIPVNRLGRVIRSPRGGYDGWFIRVESEDGGFSILFLKDPTDRTAEAYDTWVEDEQALCKRLHDWIIEWANGA